MTLFRSIYYAFPVQLLVLHLRNHLTLVLLWLILVAFSSGLVGRFFGIHYLMLTPEYWGKVNFWSYLLTGTAFGGMVMIWHLTTYLLCSNRFPFLATLSAPFTKYCLNNSLIPLAFLAIYMSCTVWFQWHDELTSGIEIVWNIAGFITGMTAITGFLAAFLHLTNKDIYSLKHPMVFSPKPGARLLSAGQRLPTVREIQLGVTSWQVHTYLTERLHVRLVRSVSHYDPRLLERVFRQNHWNAVMVQVVAMLLLMVQGVFLDSAWLRIPAAATIFLLVSIGFSLFGAVKFWFRQWSGFVMIALFVMVDLVTGWGFFNYRNRAYGLDYRTENRAPYSYEALESIATPKNIARDKAATKEILEEWLAKNRTPDNPRPKLVLICVSGGGMRSAMWTMQTLQKADFATGGSLLQQAALITGASGGMLGAAYVREAMLRHHEGDRLSPQDPTLLDDMGKDLLNAISFAVVSNDLFFPMSTFNSGNFTYRKDRGYLFEHQLNENCRGYLSKRLGAYRDAEQKAKIPMMVLSPYILNDARRLLISPQGVSYLMRPAATGRMAKQLEVDGVDFGKLFANQQSDSLAFTSALRMNCTYPFILPNVWLPTRPSIEAMDAGLRDNYGLGLAVRFTHVFKDWIEDNTGGVVFVQIRCFDKINQIAPSDDKGIIDNLFAPATAAAKMTDIQDFEQDNALTLLSDILGKSNVEMVRFHYHAVQKKREASMSFHLSKREKLDLLESFYAPENQAALKALKQILKHR
jgi:hypothetical protein